VTKEAIKDIEENKGEMGIVVKTFPVTSHNALTRVEEYEK
jgi:hypothetical protein